MYKLHKEVELNVEKTKQEIADKNIIFTPHVDEVIARKGRPSQEAVSKCLKVELNKLYKIIKGRKDRIILVFYLSRKYDLRIVVRIKKKDLYVITFYFHTKRLKRWQ